MAVVAGLMAIIAPVVMMFMRQRQRPGGFIIRYGERDEIRGGPPDGPGTDGQAPGPGFGWRGDRSYGREESPGQHPHREQDHSYWEAEQENGTLEPNGFIGDSAEADAAQADPPRADPRPGKPDGGVDGPARW